MAFLPVLPLITGAVLLKLSKTPFTVSKTALIVVPLVLAFLWLSAVVLAPSDDAFERVGKLSIVAVLGTLFLSVLYAGRRFTSPHFSKILLGFCSVAACFISAEILLDAPVYNLLRPDATTEGYTMSVFNRGALVVTFSSLLVLYLERFSMKKWVYLLYVPIIVMLFLVESQSAQIAALSGVLFFFLFPFAQRWAWGMLYILLAVGCLSAPFAIQKIYQQLPDTVQDAPLLHEAYVGSRIEIWDFISRKALDKPIIGHGIEFTRDYEDFETKGRFLESNRILHPHNAVLQIWIELGLLGIMAFLVLAALFSIRIYHIEDDRIRRASLSIASVFFLVTTFSYGLWQGWWLGLMFVLAGIIVSQTARAQHKA